MVFISILRLLNYAIFDKNTRVFRPHGSKIVPTPPLTRRAVISTRFSRIVVVLLVQQSVITNEMKFK